MRSTILVGRIKPSGSGIFSQSIAHVIIMKCSVFVAILASVCFNCCVCSDATDLQLKVLSKQVSALLDRRREDIQIIEENMRKSLAKSRELVDVKEEMKILR